MHRSRHAHAEDAQARDTSVSPYLLLPLRDRRMAEHEIDAQRALDAQIMAQFERTDSFTG